MITTNTYQFLPLNFQKTTAVVSGMNGLQIQTKLKSSEVVLMMAMTYNRDAKWSYNYCRYQDGPMFRLSTS